MERVKLAILGILVGSLILGGVCFAKPYELTPGVGGEENMPQYNSKNDSEILNKIEEKLNDNKQEVFNNNKEFKKLLLLSVIKDMIRDDKDIPPKVKEELKNKINEIAKSIVNKIDNNNKREINKIIKWEKMIEELSTDNNYFSKELKKIDKENVKNRIELMLKFIKLLKEEEGDIKFFKEGENIN